jgi:prevent-host-death family protein
MEDVTISELRIHCHEIVNRVAESGEGVRIIRKGECLGMIVPISEEIRRESEEKRQRSRRQPGK